MALRAGALCTAQGRPQARAASGIIEHSSNCLGSKVSSAAAPPRQRALVPGGQGSRPEGGRPEGWRPEGSRPEGSRPEGSGPEVLGLEVQDAGTEESDQVLSWLHERTHRYRKRSMIKIGSRKKKTNIFQS